MKTISQIFKNVLLVALIGLISVQTHAQTVTSTYYHTDALGSIVAASDEQGDIIWEKTYDPYGNEVISTEDGDEFEGQAYTGKPYDEETGLVYLGQRYYDPEIKRFMGMDPVGFKASNPASFNRYAYANNNPYRFVDPDGREGQDVRQNILTRSLGAGQIGRQEFQEFSEVPPEVGVIAVGGLGVLAVRSAYLAYLANAYRVNQAGIVAAEVVADVTIASSAVGIAAKSAARLCFVEGTPVHTKDGVKPIEEIEIGDLVTSKNDKTGEVEWKPVVELFRNNDKEVLNIGFAGPFGKLETLGVTAEHPFWVEGKGWTNAGDLAIDDEISTLENGVVKVASIASDAKKHTTYNFEVEDFHTYFVGESALWVHNMCADDVVAGLARSQPNLFRNFNCDSCAQGIASALQKEGISGSIVRLQVSNPSGAGNLVFFGDKVIGRSGFHEFVVTGGKVFDNLNPRGIPIKEFNSQLKFNGAFDVIEKAF